MESTEHLQKHLASLQELQAIVRTMKALSAASIRQYEQASDSLVDYYRTVELGLHAALLPAVPRPSQPFEKRKSPPRLGSVVFGSDHGLCGRFNEDIAAYASEKMTETQPNREDRKTLAVGARVAAALEAEGQPPEEDFLVPGAASRITSTVRQILLKVDEWQTEDNVEAVDIFHNRPSGRSGYETARDRLVPIDWNRFERLEKRPWPTRRLPLYTMDRGQLLSDLLRQYFFVVIFRACAESQAAEHGNRLAAMQSAEKNLQEKLEQVTMTYRRVRQDSITSELLDVVSGFEAISTDSS